MKQMKRYKEAPDWWFSVMFIIMFAIGLGTMLGYPTHLTWWAYIITILISCVWMVRDHFHIYGKGLAETDIARSLSV
jgi:4-hydroxybenzoate polyprenyltransferase